MAGSMVDFLDVLVLLPVLAMMAIVLGQLPAVEPARLALFALLCANGVAIALALHILVAAFGGPHPGIGKRHLIYRDVMFMGKFPSTSTARRPAGP